MLELKLKSWMDLHNLVVCQDMHTKKGRKELTTSFQECSWHKMKCTLTFRVSLNYQSANSPRNYYELLWHNALRQYSVIFFVHLCHWSWGWSRNSCCDQPSDKQMFYMVSVMLPVKVHCAFIRKCVTTKSRSDKGPQGVKSFLSGNLLTVRCVGTN